MLSDIVSLLMLVGAGLAALVVWSVVVAVPASYVLRRFGNARLEPVRVEELRTAEPVGAGARTR